MIGASCLTDLMPGVIGRLTGHAGFSAASSGGVFDAVPQDTSYPHTWVTLREDPDGMETFGRIGYQAACWLQVFCRDDAHEGGKLIDAVLHQAVLALKHQPLSVSGWTVVLVEYEGASSMPNLQDTDGQIVRSKIGRFRMWLEQA